jgi:hypothetical protein
MQKGALKLGLANEFYTHHSRPKANSLSTKLPML